MFVGCGLGLFKKKFFLLKSDAGNGLSRFITRRIDIDQFSRQNFDVQGMRNSILVSTSLEKSEKNFFRKH